MDPLRFSQVTETTGLNRDSSTKTFAFFSPECLQGVPSEDCVCALANLNVRPLTAYICVDDSVLQWTGSHISVLRKHPNGAGRSRHSLENTKEAQQPSVLRCPVTPSREKGQPHTSSRRPGRFCVRGACMPAGSFDGRPSALARPTATATAKVRAAAAAAPVAGAGGCRAGGRGAGDAGKRLKDRCRRSHSNNS